MLHLLRHLFARRCPRCAELAVITMELTRMVAVAEQDVDDTQARLDAALADNRRLRAANLQLQTETTEYRELVGAVVVRKEARA